MAAVAHQIQAIPRSVRKYFSAIAVGVEGKFDGIVAEYGVIDLHGDVFHKGAFTKTVRERPTVAIHWEHDLTKEVGAGSLAMTDAGLSITAQLDLTTEIGAAAFAAVKAKLNASLSGTFAIPKSRAKLRDGGGLDIFESRVDEVSVVNRPAQVGAKIERVKSLEEAIARAKAGDYGDLSIGEPGDLADLVEAWLDETKSRFTEDLDNLKSFVATSMQDFVSNKSSLSTPEATPEHSSEPLHLVHLDAKEIAKEILSRVQSHHSTKNR